MREILLITGGCRSGKSARALALGEGTTGPRGFIATCPRLDGEMEARIVRHRREREAGGWQTLECETDLVGALSQWSGMPVLLVDCLSLWVNNLIFNEQEASFDEDDISQRCGEVVNQVRNQEGLLLLVTNEVGLGIVPDNALARRYRDLLGRCNQVFAAAAARVEFMVAGIPMTVKDQSGRDQSP